MTTTTKTIDRHGRTIYTGLSAEVVDRIFAVHHRDIDVVMVNGNVAARNGNAEGRVDATIRRAGVSR